MKNTIILLLALIVVSCGTQKVADRGTQYPKMYEEKPASIVVMPPINQTNHVEAKEYFYTTMYLPLCEKGYYVYSPMLTMEMFQSESAYDSEMFLEQDLSSFRNALGADAAMFTIIKDWKRNSVGGKITVTVEYILRSTKTGEKIYEREGTITVDTNVYATGGGILGGLISLAATAINTATTDKVIAGRKCTAFVLSDMPEGKYSPLFEKDQLMPAGETKIKATVSK